MDIGILSDIHGNKVALERVLDDMPSVDALVCAGDVVGYNPWHAECVEVLRDREIPTVMGNHDQAVIGEISFGFNSAAGAAVEHARSTLSDDHIEWLADLPVSRYEFDDRVKILHSNPKKRGKYTFPEQFSPALLGDEDVLVLGHTHQQYHERYEGGIVINPGSVGQPRDRDPRAAYAVLDLDSMTVTEHRVSYDIERVQRAVEDAGLPSWIGERLESGQ
jgi:putative phosphoesterase